MVWWTGSRPIAFTRHGIGSTLPEWRCSSTGRPLLEDLFDNEQAASTSEAFCRRQALRFLGDDALQAPSEDGGEGNRNEPTNATAGSVANFSSGRDRLERLGLFHAASK
jgi:hypothetical protein